MVLDLIGESREVIIPAFPFSFFFVFLRYRCQRIFIHRILLVKNIICEFDKWKNRKHRIAYYVFENKKMISVNYEKIRKSGI